MTVAYIGRDAAALRQSVAQLAGRNATGTQVEQPASADCDNDSPDHPLIVVLCCCPCCCCSWCIQVVFEGSATSPDQLVAAVEDCGFDCRLQSVHSIHAADADDDRPQVSVCVRRGEGGEYCRQEGRGPSKGCAEWSQRGRRVVW